MEQRTGGNSQENVFGWTTKCTDLFFQSSMLGSMRCYLFIQLHSDYSCPHLTYHTQVDFFIPVTQHSNLSNAWQRAPASGFRPKMSNAWMFLIRWNQYYETSFPMKHYSPFPCSERLEGKEYRRNMFLRKSCTKPMNRTQPQLFLI